MIVTWNMMRMQYEYCGIELDLIPANTEQKLEVRAPPDSGNVRQSTDLSRVCPLET